MKIIGFVDYYLGEWHADNYPEMIKKANKSLGTDYVVKYAWAEIETSPINGVSTDEWCEKFNVEKVNSIEELCEKSDVILVLAPSNPEKHLQYAKTVLKYGKRTYIDKTFAPNLKEAEEIYALSEKYNTPFFSTSALRYATELNDVTDRDNVMISGGGGNFEEYIIHTAEIATVLLNERAQKVKVEKFGRKRTCTIVTESGKKFSVLFAPGFGFSVYTDNGTFHLKSDFFGGLMLNILKFYETGTVPFDKSQTLNLMAMREALIEAQGCEGNWLDV